MKKILIGVAVVVVIVVAAMLYLNNRNRTLSPSGKAELTVGDLTVSLPYSRPSVRGRVIFGTEEDGALQPNGKYWRLGANETTQITFSKDVTFNGQPVKAGSYRIYSIPGKDSFEIRLNSEISFWGYSEPDYSKDVLKTQVSVEQSATSVEQFTMTLAQQDSGMNLIIEWSTVKLTIPIMPQ